MEHYEELLNPVDISSLQEAVKDITGVLDSISVAEVTIAFIEICQKYNSSRDVVGAEQV